ncbi:hypothetical protein [Puniceicoccus vermicola]|uniref:HEAT repeat domain-containing protein n=1 Tax=Puniceicoccus vermicola TaxID=388746 RepID=A0A7X1AWX0_9BACT|nr:hypothetical protein [Puniceicoccus vermicola]MBC2601471.1 hypothetical protein [Puniceicoccus vermicola]
MATRTKVRFVLVSLWVATVAAAFTAGQRMTDSSSRAEADDESSIQAVGADSKAPTNTVGREIDLASGLQPIEGEIGGNEPLLSQVLKGSRDSEDLRSATLEAELLGPEDARYWAESYLRMPPDPGRNRLLSVLLGSLAESAPLEALQMAQGIGSVSASEQARRRILESWARRDPQAALTWLEENRGSIPGRMHSGRLESWMEGYAETDPGGAFAYVVGMSEQSNSDRWLKRRLIESVVEAQVAGDQLEEALASLQSLPQGLLRSEALQEFYSEWAKQDPAGAAEHFLSNREEGSERAAAGLIREWASSDPESAAGFVSTLEATDPAYQVAISSLIERWSRYDLEGPAQWLNELPPSEGIDRAVAVFSVRASEEDPEGAMTWAASIASEQTRSRVMQRVAANWKETDPDGLEEFIESSEFDEETAKQLREARGRPRWRGPY